MIAAVFGVMLVVAVFAYFFGFYLGMKADVKANLADAGLTRGSAQLYHRAAKLLNGMVRITDLDGDFAADILSEPTKKQVNEWLADYRKQVVK